MSLCVTGTENMTIDGGPVHNNLSSLQTQHKWWSIQHKYIPREIPEKHNFKTQRKSFLRKKVWHRSPDIGGCGLDWAGPGSWDHERHYAMISDVSPSLSLSSSLSLSPRYWQYGAKKRQYITAKPQPQGRLQSMQWRRNETRREWTRRGRIEMTK